MKGTFVDNCQKRGLPLHRKKKRDMYINQLILPLLNTEQLYLYDSNVPKGLIQCSSGNHYPFELFPYRVEKMGRLVLEFSTPNRRNMIITSDDVKEDTNNCNCLQKSGIFTTN